MGVPFERRGGMADVAGGIAARRAPLSALRRRDMVAVFVWRSRGRGAIRADGSVNDADYVR